MKKIASLFFILLLLSLAFAGYGYWRVMKSSVNPTNQPITFIVSQGEDVHTVGNHIVAAGGNLNVPLFMLAARLTGAAKKIKTGEYKINPGMTSDQVLNMLARGDTTMERIAIVEGWTFQKMRDVLNAHPKLRHDTQDWTDEQILNAVGADKTMPEGLFFPDTYRFSAGSSDIKIFKMAFQTMRKKLNAAWEARDPSLPYKTPYDALIMASIVEKETGHPEDRAHIAGVFINRLRRGMRLQTDPTVIYGMGSNYTGIIRRSDLQTDTPYNTYTRSGLPPTPIALPGYAALEAAVRPANTNALYFVAKGDQSGKSQFSNTLDQHNSAVQSYRQRVRMSEETGSPAAE